MHLTNHSFLFTVGAVLAFAVHVDVAAVDVTAVGWVFMLVAVLATVLEVAGAALADPCAAVPGDAQPVPARVPPARATPSTAPWDTREFRAVQRPAGES